MSTVKKKVVYSTVLKNNNTEKKYYVYMYLYLALQLLICFLLSYNVTKIICYRKRKKKHIKNVVILYTN